MTRTGSPNEVKRVHYNNCCTLSSRSPSVQSGKRNSELQHAKRKEADFVFEIARRLVPTSRYYPLRFHLVRALLRIVQRTSTFIPLSTPLFEILNSPELSKRSKPSTLKPLDWEYYLKCPTSYQRTRVYADALAEETIHLLTEFFGGSLSKSIAFPELALPAIVVLKRLSKKTLQNKGQVKLSGSVKILIEKLESNSKWIEQRREVIEFGPMKRDKVERFLKDEDEARTPMGTHLKLMRRAREARKATLERGVSRTSFSSDCGRLIASSRDALIGCCRRGHLEKSSFSHCIASFLVFFLFARNTYPLHSDAVFGSSSTVS